MTRATTPTKRHVRPDGADAFLPDPEGGPALVDDDLAEMLAEEFVSGANSGEDGHERGHEAFVDEEMGGPFVPSSGATEFARDIDASNPEGAEVEAFPTSQSES